MYVISEIIWLPKQPPQPKKCCVLEGQLRFGKDALTDTRETEIVHHTRFWELVTFFNSYAWEMADRRRLTFKSISRTF